MAFEQKNDTGALFRKNDREKDTDPTHSGSAKIDGIDYYISAWVNESKTGLKYFSLKFTKKEQWRPTPTSGADSFDDDVPF